MTSPPWVARFQTSNFNNIAPAWVWSSTTLKLE
ncbi:hypothetical protein CP02DC14_1420, partial [Chlamydia psittaci 02DC14]